MRTINKVLALLGYQGIGKVLSVILLVSSSNAQELSFNPLKMNFEYGASYYYYKEMILKDESNSKETFMELTSSPVLHTFTADIRRYINYRWNSETLITLTLGNVNYNSMRTGSATGEDNFILAIENTVNYCVNNNVCANFGYGFRYLDNDSNQSVTTTGSFGYERENYLHFLPIGLKINKRVENPYIEWYQVRTKYYHFLDGRQISHFTRFGCESDLKNKQNSGYGVEASIRLYNKNKKWFYGGQIQYWDIEASDNMPVKCFGAESYGSEPANTTFMAGLIVGYRYLQS